MMLNFAVIQCINDNIHGNLFLLTTKKREEHQEEKPKLKIRTQQQAGAQEGNNTITTHPARRPEASKVKNVLVSNPSELTIFVQYS